MSSTRFQALAGGTRRELHEVNLSVGARDGALASGMEHASGQATSGSTSS